MSESSRGIRPGAGLQERGGPDVVVIGNLTIDDIVHANGETTMASPGGNTLHAAAGARIWGVSVGVVARVGADFPAAALDRLRDAGIDILGLRPIAGPTVRNWVVYEEDGRRTWVYRTPPERSLEVAPRPEDVPAEWTGQHGRTPVVHVAAMPFSSAARIVEHVRGKRRGGRDAGHARSLDGGTRRGARPGPAGRRVPAQPGGAGRHRRLRRPGESVPRTVGRRPARRRCEMRPDGRRS